MNKSFDPDYDATFGNAAADYARHRAGFPQAFIDALKDKGIGLAGQRILDIGTGTGTLARSFAGSGALVTGLDRDPDMLVEATRLARESELDIPFINVPAEATGLPAQSFDIISAGQCWHWFDKSQILPEMKRLLVSGGALVIAHFDWLPIAGNIVDATVKLIEQHNPDWPLGGFFAPHDEFRPDLQAAGFMVTQKIQFDMKQSYSHQAWRGRIRASAGVGGTLASGAVDSFDRDLKEMLAADFPSDPLDVPHRCWAIICTEQP